MNTDFKPDVPLVVHWDGKLLQDLTGDEHIDRLPMLVSGKKFPIADCCKASFRFCILDSVENLSRGKKKEILFVIDCRYEVREQINFIERTVDYLRYNRNWASLKVSYMTFEDKEPTSLEVLTANITDKASEISNQCNGTISVDELFFKTKQNTLTFDSQNFQKSYYNEKLTSISHNEGVKYCNKEFNSYLISIETYEEVDYLISKIFEIARASWEFSKSITIHLGLYKMYSIESYKWSSGNPFTFYHELNDLDSRRCVYFNYSTDANETLTFRENKNVWKYLYTIVCDQTINQTYLVCEYHHLKPAEVNVNIRPVNKPGTEDFIYDVFKRNRFHYTKTIDCSLHSHPIEENKSLLCREKNHSTSTLTYVHVMILSESIYDTLTSQCLFYYTSNSRSSVNASIIQPESFDFSNNSKPIDTCLLSEGTMPRNIQIVKCKKTQNVFPRCIYVFNYGCTDNSHLENCETFECPNGFIKCPNSYCITAGDTGSNCPLGQEEAIFEQTKLICSAKLILKFKELCLNSKSHFIIKIRRQEVISYYGCNDTCPIGYSCLSYNGGHKPTSFIEESVDLFNIADSLLPDRMSNFYSSFKQIISISVPNCKIQNVDKSLEHRNTEETVILDLSKNQISGSQYVRSLQSMTNLLFLNLSHNDYFSINKESVFPDSLEEIDLSFTSVTSLPVNCFENLTNLRILNLRHTKITRFDNMGLPENFKLDTLNIQGLVLTDIHVNFFKGLIVRTSLRTSDFKLCCQQIRGINILSKICQAPDDAITSCKHIVGDTSKRILVWVVGLLTIAGNGVVLIYRVVWSREKIFQTAYGLFVTGLAVSDFLMGVYLIIIAVVDVVYADVYVVYDESWRKSLLCKFSGVLSTLSSETSTFLIGLITLDRFISISYPFSAHDTSTSLKWKGFISTWVIGFVLALIPAVVPEWQIYSSNGLCLALPLSTTGSDKLPGWEFSMAVYVILNFILFIFIALGQVGIFMNVIKKRNLPSIKHCSDRRTQDMSIAKKLAFVAVSDFLCWFPIGIMGILSLIGQEFDKETYAWMAVFVLPVNSALNPMIYTIPVIVHRLTYKH
ncbi:hypothetical protein Btru_049888 [Bulinus truncatus]|nr:hypothetical protein Btru_049888 [Bulinus truncatus]